jgi:hypothetical protein
VVFVLGKKKKPLMPCTERRARLLLSRKRAVVVRLYPFTIRLKDRVDGDLQPIRLSVDPGSKFSGISITREKEEKKEDSTPKEVRRSSYVLFLIELLHRGQAIRDALVSRSSFRRSRRNRKLRYRAPRFLNRILKNLQTPLKDAAAVNTTRWSLFEALKSLTLPLEVGSGGLTKWNRIRFQIPKTHALDAACVGKREDVQNWNCPILSIRCTGRGSYQRTRLTKYGFPRGYLMRKKSVQGFQTGDLVHAEVPQGRHKGTYRGRVAIRASGSFNIQTQDRLIQGISHRYCRLIWRADGYSYSQKIALQRKECQKEHASRVTLSLRDLKVEVSRTV